MGPFSRKTNDDINHCENENVYNNEMRLRITPELDRISGREEPSQSSSPYSTVKSDQQIRSLSFFREQERQFAETADEEEEWQERQSPINFLLISAVLIVTAVSGWFCYRWLNPSSVSQPPVISSEMESVKVRPENPGGMVIPHQDKLIYNRLSPEQQQHQPVERLLPMPEQPMAPPEQQQPQAYVDQNGQIVYAQPLPVHPQQAPVYGPQQPQAYAPTPMAAPTSGTPPAQAPMPAPVYGPQQAPAGTPGAYQQAPVYAPLPPVYGQPAQQAPHAYQQPTPPHALATPTAEIPAPALDQTQERPLPAPLPPMPSQSIAAQQSIPQTESATAPLSPAPIASDVLDKDALDTLIAEEAKPKDPAKTNKAPLLAKDIAAPIKAATSHYRVQLATFNNEKEALLEANRIKTLDTVLFKDKKLQIIKTESRATKKPLYLVVVTGFATPNQATQFSSKLRVHKIKGIVLTPPNGQ